MARTNLSRGLLQSQTRGVPPYPMRSQKTFAPVLPARFKLWHDNELISQTSLSLSFDLCILRVPSAIKLFSLYHINYPSFRSGCFSSQHETPSGCPFLGRGRQTNRPRGECAGTLLDNPSLSNHCSRLIVITCMSYFDNATRVLMIVPVGVGKRPVRSLNPASGRHFKNLGWQCKI